MSEITNACQKPLSGADGPWLMMDKIENKKEQAMTSRERVLAAINHQQPNQIPVDMGSNPSSGISAVGYTKLKKALGITSGHTRIFDVVQQLAQVEDEVIDSLGIDIINPVQTNCFEMEPEKLKAEFGKDITFWGGGCDTASILNKATPEEVRKHVLERCELFSKGGGFIFNTIHNILPEVPAENILAAFGAVREFNRGSLV